MNDLRGGTRHPPDPSPVTVRLRGAGKSYGERRVLSGVDLTLRPGEIVGFIGPNGAGKTTLIKILSGLARATEGEVEVLGEDLKKKAQTPQGVGLVSESQGFIPYLSGRKNLRLLAGIRKVANERDIEETLRLVGLDPSDRRAVRAYSLGMKQRLGLAQALMERPKLLLLDEPTNGLDPQGIIDLRILTRRLAEDGVSVFVASHLLTEVEQVCDRVLLVRQGVVAREIDQKEVTRPALRLTVSSNADVATIFEWADVAGASVETTEDTPLSVEILVEKRTPEVVKELVESGVNVEEITKARRSLEKEFLKLVAEES